MFLNILVYILLIRQVGIWKILKTRSGKARVDYNGVSVVGRPAVRDVYETKHQQSKDRA